MVSSLNDCGCSLCCVGKQWVDRKFSVNSFRLLISVVGAIINRPRRMQSNHNKFSANTYCGSPSSVRLRLPPPSLRRLCHRYAAEGKPIATVVDEVTGSQ